MSIDLDALERLAAKATPGPWVARNDDPKDSPMWTVLTEADRVIADAEPLTWDASAQAWGKGNAEFIAACSPEVVAALVRAAQASRRYRLAERTLYVSDTFGHDNANLLRAVIAARQALDAALAPFAPETGEETGE